MRFHRLLTAATVLVLAVLALPVRAAPSAVSGVAPALMRFMLASAKYTDMAVEIDGRQVLRQPANTASAYIAISADQPHTLAVYGLSLGDPAPTLVRRIADYRLAQGSYNTSIFADDGTLHHPEPALPVPAGKSILNPVLAGPVSLSFGPSFRFGSIACVS